MPGWLVLATTARSFRSNHVGRNRRQHLQVDLIPTGLHVRQSGNLNELIPTANQLPNVDAPRNGSARCLVGDCLFGPGVPKACQVTCIWAVIEAERLFAAMSANSADLSTMKAVLALPPKVLTMSIIPTLHGARTHLATLKPSAAANVFHFEDFSRSNNFVATSEALPDT
jgi:hypothetical protein